MSIQSNEIRIGNYLQCQMQPNAGQQLIVITGTKQEVGHSAFISWRSSGCCPAPFVLLNESYSGIPLMPEWLEKLGFEIDHTNQSWFHRVFVKGDGQFQIEEYQDRLRFGINGGEYYIGPELKYVHQLQNLFFALTGQELALTML